jgi:hypothetical protein
MQERLTAETPRRRVTQRKHHLSDRPLKLGVVTQSLQLGSLVSAHVVACPSRRALPDKKITEERLGRVSLPFFLRPFNGCVPQPSKKRRLFDSHNPNSLMVAELRATISKVSPPVPRLFRKAKSSTPKRVHRTLVSSDEKYLIINI